MYSLVQLNSPSANVEDNSNKVRCVCESWI